MMAVQNKAKEGRYWNKERLHQNFKKNWMLYAMFIPVFLAVFLFTIVPTINNLVLTFKDYNHVSLGTSANVGLKNYKEFFGDPNFTSYLANTLVLNLLILLIGFPGAIIVAVLLFENKNKHVKNFTQTATFLPYFISIVVVTGIVKQFFDPNTGLMVLLFGDGAKYLYDKPHAFRWVYSIMDVWQTLGYNVLIYYAALTTIDLTLYEAAEIDGAGRFRRFLSVTVPGIMPTIIITLLLRIGKIMQMGAEKVLLLQTVGNRATSEILGTYAYNKALAGMNPNFGLAAVAGLFDAVVAIILIYLSNKSAKRISEESLW